MCEKRKNNMNKDMISSVHINFLFGAGVNGGAFPKLDGFNNTKEKLKELNVPEELGFEGGIDTLNEDERLKIKTSFIKEFKENVEKIDYEHESISNIGLMLSKIAQIINMAQNRTNSMKQINIYSLNYDNIVEDVLERNGLYYKSISTTNIDKNSRLMNVVGYDYQTKKCIPTFLVSKIHGDISKPIIPGKEKYKEILDENYFEIAFNMKEHLSRQNSILIVIGYSGNDKHINKLINECVANGLIVFWYKYSNIEISEGIDAEHIYFQEQIDYEVPEDTTLLCYKDLKEIWEEKLEK